MRIYQFTPAYKQSLINSTCIVSKHSAGPSTSDVPKDKTDCTQLL